MKKYHKISLSLLAFTLILTGGLQLYSIRPKQLIVAASNRADLERHNRFLYLHHLIITITLLQLIFTTIVADFNTLELTMEQAFRRVVLRVRARMAMEATLQLLGAKVLVTSRARSYLQR